MKNSRNNNAVRRPVKEDNPGLNGVGIQDCVTCLNGILPENYFHTTQIYHIKDGY
jgi:hypothetical protein